MTDTTLKEQPAAWLQRQTSDIEVRAYQVEAWQKLWTERAAGRSRALIHLATGLGKTSVAAVDAWHYQQEERPGARILFVSHMTDVNDQARQTFQRIAPNLTTVKFRQGKQRDADVTFATFQALMRRLNEMPADHYDYIIWDEAHHIEATTFKLVREHFQPKFELGLTATPERADGRDILEYLGEPLYTKSLAEGIAEGWLSPVDYHLVFDDAVKNAMKDGFSLKSLKDVRSLFRVRVRNEVIAENVRQHRHQIGMDTAKTIVFCQNQSAAEEMAVLLGGKAYHADIPKDQRIEILREFRTGRLQVICTVDMFNEGIDIPDARLVVFLRSTSSRTIFEQQLGRGLRRHPGKTDVKVLDFVANVERINFVRDLGHTISKHRGSSEAYSGKNDSQTGIARADHLEQPLFTSSHFEFEDETIELLQRYDTLKARTRLNNDDVVAAYRELNSVPRVAERFDVSWNAIWKHLRRAGIYTAAHPIRDVPTEDLITKYQALGSLNETARYFGVDPATIRARFRKADFKYTSTNKKQYASPELIEAFGRLGSVRKAALELGMSRSTARKQLINSGVHTGHVPNIKVPEAKLAEAYRGCNGDIVAIVKYLGGGSWADIYRALDEYGYLERRQGPVTSAQAAAAYFKFGTSTKAGESLGVSGNTILKKTRGALWIPRYGRGRKKTKISNRQLAMKES